MDDLQSKKIKQQIVKEIFNVHLDPDYADIFSFLEIGNGYKDVYVEILSDSKNYFKNILTQLKQHSTGKAEKPKELLNNVKSAIAISINDQNTLDIIAKSVFNSIEHCISSEVLSKDDVQFLFDAKKIDELIQGVEQYENIKELSDFLDYLQSYVKSQFSNHALISLFEGVKSLFFNPNCKTMQDVIDYIGVDVSEHKQMIEQKITKYLSQKLQQYDLDYYNKGFQLIHDVLKKSVNSDQYSNILSILSKLITKTENLVNCSNMLLNIKDKTDKYDFNKISDIVKNFSNIEHDISEIKILYQNFITEIYDIYINIMDIISNIDIKDYLLQAKKLFFMVSMYSDNYDDFKKEIQHKILSNNNTQIDSIGKVVIQSILHQFDENVTQNKNVPIVLLINQIDAENEDFIKTIKDSINKTLETVTSKYLFNKKLSDLKQLNKLCIATSNFVKDNYKDMILPFELYKEFVYDLLNLNGYNLSKLFPPVDYIKQHFGDNKDIIKEKINEYITQTTVMLKSVIFTFKYPIKLFMFDSLLEYQKIIGDKSVLTPERINQLRSQIVQVLDFININNIDVSKKVSEGQIKQIIKQNFDIIDDKQINAISIGLTKNINNVISLYKQKFNKKLKNIFALEKQTNQIIKQNVDVIDDKQNNEDNANSGSLTKTKYKIKSKSISVFDTVKKSSEQNQYTEKGRIKKYSDI